MNRMQAGLAAVLSVALVTPLAAQEAAGTLDKIKSSGEIALGIRESSVPFSYLDENQQPVGYSIDLCLKIVDAVKAEIGTDVKVKYVPVNAKTRIPLMANGTIDLECGSTTNTLSRQEQVDFLPTTFITGTKMLVRKDSGIEKVEDLDGKAVGLAQGSTNERVIQDKIKELNLKVKPLSVRDHAEGMLALETGRIDAYASDHILLFGLKAKSKTPDDFAVVSDFLSYDPYALMVRRNDSTFKLVGTKAMAALFRSGEINDLYNKWFEPLGVEETDQLKASFQLNALPE